MHFVLQQEWINGKRYLVKDGERDSLLDVLNLPSEAPEKEREAEVVAEVMESEEVLALPEEPQETEPAAAGEEVLALPEELQETEPAVAGEEPLEVPPEDQEVEVASAGPETPEEVPVAAEGPEEAPAEQDMAVTWYYWPNGTIWRN